MKPEILVIRDHDVFSAVLIENGFSVTNLPLIKIAPVRDFSELDSVMSNLSSFDGIFITSPHAAAPFLARLKKLKIHYPGKLYILGSRADNLFKAAKLPTIYNDNVKSAAELIGSIGAEYLTSKSFLYVRGNLSLRTIPEKLKNTANISEIVVYNTTPVKLNQKQLETIKHKLAHKKFSAVCFFSPSSAESFCKQFGAEILHQTRIATIGKTTAEFFERRNLNVDFISPKASAEDFALGLIKYLRENVTTDTHR